MLKWRWAVLPPVVVRAVCWGVTTGERKAEMGGVCVGGGI